LDEDKIRKYVKWQQQRDAEVDQKVADTHGIARISVYHSVCQAIGLAETEQRHGQQNQTQAIDQPPDDGGERTGLDAGQQRREDHKRVGYKTDFEGSLLETERPGATASAAFHAFRPEMLNQLRAPKPRPMSEVVILGAQHEHNLGQRALEYDQPRTVRIQVLLEDYTDTYGCVERRLAAYELDRAGLPARRIGYLPKDAPRQTGKYLAILKRPEGKRRLEGILSSLRHQPVI